MDRNISIGNLLRSSFEHFFSIPQQRVSDVAVAAVLVIVRRKCEVGPLQQPRAPRQKLSSNVNIERPDEHKSHDRGNDPVHVIVSHASRMCMDDVQTLNRYSIHSDSRFQCNSDALCWRTLIGCYDSGQSDANMTFLLKRLFSEHVSVAKVFDLHL